jgi:hypothetical protein
VVSLSAGIKQSNLRRAEGWEDVDDLIAGGRLRVLDMEPVSSLSGLGDYWLVTVGDAGQPIGQALVSETGWLLSAMRFPVGGQPSMATRASVRGLADSLGFGGGAIRRTHMTTDPTSVAVSTDYRPMFTVTTGDGRTLFVSDSGAAYVVDPAGEAVAHWSDGARRFRRIH